jgi:predicted acylesterase/phospholipase RssA
VHQVRLIYAIFEGGGAKGIAHLGAVAAVEQANLAFAGVAGASAGAFVAALVAAGYRSTDLLDPNTPTHNLLAAHGVENPLALLGFQDWRRFNRVLRAARRQMWAAAFAGILGAFCVAPRSSLVLNALRRGLGHFSTDAVRDFVNDRIRERLADLWADSGKNPADVPDPVRFVDLDYETYPQLRPLKIIATDVMQMRPVLFDRTRTPEVPIGDAVAASIAIPLVFRPATVRGLPNEVGAALFVDGGLVSNLPFWVFGEEKLAVERGNPADPPVPIVAFTLVEETSGQPIPADSPSFFQFLARSARTGIFGSQVIAQSLLPDVVQVPLSTRLPLLGFDSPWVDIRADYISGRQCALRGLRIRFQIKPSFLNEHLRQAADMARGRVNELRKARGRPAVGQLRACVLEPIGRQSLRVTHGYNMDCDSDDRLMLDRRGHGAGEAFNNGDAVVMTFAAGSSPSFLTKYERALVRPGLRSAICIPIFSAIEEWERRPSERSAPLAILALDSDDDLSGEFSHPDFIDAMSETSVLISPAFQME